MKGKQYWNENIQDGEREREWEREGERGREREREGERGRESVCVYNVRVSQLTGQSVAVDLTFLEDFEN